MASVASELLADFEAVVAGRPDVDRHEVFARCRAEAPVFYSDAVEAWVVSRYDDVRGILADDDRFVLPSTGRGAPIFGRSFFQWRGREHNKKAGIVSRRIRSPRALKEGVDGMVGAIARKVADELPLGEPVDLKEQYAMWVPLLVITELTAIDEAGRFRDWYRLIVGGGISSIGNPGAREAAFAARAELEEFLVPILAERRRHPGDDLVSDLVTAEYDGAPLPDEEIVSMVVLLLSAGVETTERGLASAFAHLARHRGEWDELRARRGEEARIGSFCAETMRFTPPVHGTIRQALEPFELHGVEIAEGDKLLVLLASANRDEDTFADAQTFDPERYLDNPDRQFTSAGEILPFGAGMHHCAGSRLAEAELVHAVAELLERVEWIEPVGELPRSEGLMLHSPPALPVVLHPARR